jgi:uncharacterized protein
MVRPHKTRRVCCVPRASFFKPSGIPVSELDHIEIQLDEMEALRLSDIEKLEQEDAAQKMQISRQTFGNILRQARQKLANAIINTKAVKIGGGEVDISETFYCKGRARRQHENMFSNQRKRGLKR